MSYQTPIEIATARAANVYREDIKKGVTAHSAASLMRTTQAAELRKLAQGIDATAYACFIREDGEYRPLPLDHLLRAQVSAFLDHRDQPVCRVVRTLDMRGYRQRLQRQSETFRAWGQEFAAPAPPVEKTSLVGIMLEWQGDIYIEADDNGDPVRRAPPAEDVGNHKADSQSVTDRRVKFIEALAAAFDVQGEVPNAVKADLREVCCHYLANEPLRFTNGKNGTFNKAWGANNRIKCKSNSE